MKDESVAKLYQLLWCWAGVDFQYRKDWKNLEGWQDAWRGRIISNKNERWRFRITRYAPTFEALVSVLLERIYELQRELNA